MKKRGSLDFTAKMILFLVIFIIAFLMLRTVLKIFGAWPEWL